MAIFRSIIKELSLLLFAAVAMALVVNSMSPRGIPLVGEWDPGVGVVSAGGGDTLVDHDLEIGSIQQVKNLYDTGSHLFVDARSADDFEQEHIAGAVSFPVREFDTAIDGFIARYDPSTPIITYCSGRECTDSHELAQMLMDVGYASVKVFTDGFPAWKSGGLPVD